MKIDIYLSLISYVFTIISDWERELLSTNAFISRISIIKFVVTRQLLNNPYMFKVKHLLATYFTCQKIEQLFIFLTHFDHGI